MNSNQVMVKMILDRWFALITSFETALNEITDEQLQKEVSPGKNRGIYLLGHLIAVHDDMLRLLNWGDKLYPELAEPFIVSPDKAVTAIPSAKELRDAWQRINKLLTERINSVKAEEWFEKHTAVSAEEFSKEPHRNKLNVLLTRTTHLSYHVGQFVLLK